jgi:hypothetical protein
MAKVALIDEDGDIETLWAMPLGGELYRLDNSPFFAYGVSWLDVVEAPPESDGLPTVRRVAEKSGHRTVRVRLEDARAPEAKPFLEGLNKLGCTYEGCGKTLLSVNVPPRVSLDDVASYLVEAGVEWEYADPTYEELFPETAAQKPSEEAP